MSNRDDTEVKISSSEFVMCKINRCLITSYLMTSKLETPMIFYLVLQTLITNYPHLNMSLLRAQLVANNHWFPYMDSEPGTPNR